MLGISLQPSNPITEPMHDEGHHVHHSSGGINFILEIYYINFNRIKHLQLQLAIHVTFFQIF